MSWRVEAEMKMDRFIEDPDRDIDRPSRDDAPAVTEREAQRARDALARDQRQEDTQ